MAITPDGEYAYVPNEDNVSVINTATNTVTATVDVKGCINAVVMPNGKYACVTSSVQTPPSGEKDSVSVINTATNKVTASIILGGTPICMAITPNGEYVYVTENGLEGGGLISVISTASNSVTARIIIGDGPTAVAITPNGEYAYVAGNEVEPTEMFGVVSVIRISTNTVVTAATSTSEPITPEFPTQLMAITVLVSIIVLAVIIIARRKSGKNSSIEKVRATSINKPASSRNQ